MTLEAEVILYNEQNIITVTKYYYRKTNL